MAAEVTIRAEQPGDRDAVRAVNVAAFAGSLEADLVEQLHADGDVIVSLVAKERGQIVGHVLFSSLPVVTKDSVIQAAALAPLAVMRGWQGRGIGTRLVQAGLLRCRERGVGSVVVLGAPAITSASDFLPTSRVTCRRLGLVRT